MNLLPDPDGRIRRMPLLIQYGKRLFPALALQLAIKYSQGDLRYLDIDTDAFGGPHLNLENMRLPTDNTYSLLLNHDVQWIRRSSYSFVDVLNGTVPPGAFKHKIVLIGPTSDGVTPLFAVGTTGGGATV